MMDDLPLADDDDGRVNPSLNNAGQVDKGDFSAVVIPPCQTR